MTTFFDVLTVGCFLIMAIAYFLFSARDTRTLLHLLLSGILFGVANQLGNAGFPLLAIVLVVAGAVYSALIIRRVI